MERVRCNTELFLKSYRITRPTFGVHFITTQPLCVVTRSKTAPETAIFSKKRHNYLIIKFLTQSNLKSCIFAFLRTRESLIENIQF